MKTILSPLIRQTKTSMCRKPRRSVIQIQHAIFYISYKTSESSNPRMSLLVAYKNTIKIIYYKNNPWSTLCDSFDNHNLVSPPTCFENPEGTLIDVCLVTKPLRLKKHAQYQLSAERLSQFHLCYHNAPVSQNDTQSYQTSFHDKLWQGTQFFRLVFFIGCHALQCTWCQFMNSHLCKRLMDVIESHAPIKTKIIRNDVVPYMNSGLRKLQYQRNMARVGTVNISSPRAALQRRRQKCGSITGRVGYIFLSPVHH